MEGGPFQPPLALECTKKPSINRVKTGLSHLMSKFSLISRTDLLFPCAKIENSSKEVTLLQIKRWSRIALSFDGLFFFNVKGDIPMCSPTPNF